MGGEICLYVFINILVSRIGKSSRTEKHKHLQNLKQKYENCAKLFISNNKNHVSTKFFVNISLLAKVGAHLR